MNIVRTYLEAVRDELRIRLDLGESVQCRPDTTAEARAGEVFLGVYFGGLSAGLSPDEHEGQDYLMGFGVSVSVRTGVAPDDRLYDHSVASYGVIDTAWAVVTVMRARRYEIKQAANAALALEGVTGLWHDPPVMLSMSAPRFVGPSHWQADPAIPSARNNGLLSLVNFGRLRYMAPLP